MIVGARHMRIQRGSYNGCLTIKKSKLFTRVLGFYEENFLLILFLKMKEHILFTLKLLIEKLRS